MPTYEYRCKDCGHEFEVQQAFTDDPLTDCPSCSGALKKKFGSVGISFKGSGFYKNDSRGSSSGGASTTASSATPSSETTSSGDSGASTATPAAAPAAPAATPAPSPASSSPA
jgi:putative FmdB family regulatory protein